MLNRKFKLLFVQLPGQWMSIRQSHKIAFQPSSALWRAIHGSQSFRFWRKCFVKKCQEIHDIYKNSTGVQNLHRNNFKIIFWKTWKIKTYCLWLQLCATLNDVYATLLKKLNLILYLAITWTHQGRDRR